MKSEAENVMKACERRSSNGDLSLCGDEELAWSFRIRSSGMEVGTTTQVKLKVLPFKVKIQGLVLIDCA